MTVSGGVTASFKYNGNGERVQGTVNGVTTAYVGKHFEWSGSALTKYYNAGGQRVGMKKAGTLYFLLTDHLGSTTITSTYFGSLYSEIRYRAWGGERYSSATETPTTFRFTGQRLDSYINLYWFGSRWYDPYLAHFVQADSIIPDQNEPQSWDRYVYSYGNPVKYIDPTGHWPDLPNLLSGVLSAGAAALDITALAISFTGTVLEGAAAAGFEIATPIPGADSAVGVVGAIGIYNRYLNPIENSLSAASFGLVALSDIISKQTHPETVDIQGSTSRELVFGPDTTFSFASITVGGTRLTPEAATDTVANIGTVYYDLSRLSGNEPSWGLYEFRVGHTTGSDWFHGWYTRLAKKEAKPKDSE